MKTYEQKPNRRKNLKYSSDGSITNQHGVKITAEEKRALESAVVRANRKRSQMLKEVATLPRSVRGKPTGDTVATKLEFGYESDFIITKKTKSLQRFTSKAQFNKYMKYLERVNSDDYLNIMTRQYKRNYITALENVHGENAKDIAMKVRMMKPEKFRELIEKEELIEINDIYHEDDKAAARERLRASFGMKSKDEDAFYNSIDEE